MQGKENLKTKLLLLYSNLGKYIIPIKQKLDSILKKKNKNE